jgi:DNA-binding NtrC family response regulator/tetratricopeptide (TPR) repeat protein
LERRPGEPPAERKLGECQRLALLLEGAALLSHLDLAGWRLADGWSPAVVGSEGRLRAVSIEPGSSPEWPQTLLLDLSALLFGPLGEGEGGAQRSATWRALRRLWGSWRQSVARLPPDEAVRELFEAAPFLWRPPFAGSRVALAAAHLRRGAPQLWVAGPSRFRRGLLRKASDLEGLRRLLADPAVRSLWDAERPSGNVVELARRRHARGRYREALAAIERESGSEARVLRVRCLADLGRCTSARHTLRRLRADSLAPQQVLELAETAVRLYANLGEPERAQQWLGRALDQRAPALRARAALLGAAAAWDEGDLERMERRLAEARPALEPGLAWRWLHLAALGALTGGRPERAEELLAEALGRYRRGLAIPEAAALWNELGVARALGGELARAERAFRYAWRLLRRCEGSRGSTLALVNLAEVRMRRGHLRGVRELFEASADRNARVGNRRGWVYDQELLARYELAIGRPEAALARLDRTLADEARAARAWRREELQALAARALGWLGRAEEAAERLESGGWEGRQAVEPEERPALIALAGRRERALRECAGTPAAGPWTAVLAGALTLPSSAWHELRSLDPYRLARWVFDVDLVAPGAVSPERLRWAAALLRQAGAEPLAARLEDRASGAWRALRRYLESEVQGIGSRLDEIGALFVAAHCPEARLTWERDGRSRLLLAGAGGERTLSLELAGGRLTLSARRVDQRIKALFALAVRDLGPRLAEVPSTEPEAALIGESRALVEALERAGRLASGEMPVLLLGETGTGKEVVARWIHQASPRRDGPLVAVNCAALSPGLLLSELFGHVRGAFTGAERERTGIFEEAAGGTVLLDEIGDLPLEAQGSLLRVLQEGEVRRVGQNRPRKVDVRVLAATHRRLEERVSRGHFREDLLFRLKAGCVRLPPLRERGGDVLLLADHFLAALRPRATLTKEARERLLAHRWPGNVRELRNRVEVAAALAGGDPIRPEHLDLTEEPPSGSLYHRRIREVRDGLVREALEAARGNQAAAARRLGITRQAFSYLVRRLDPPAGDGGR